MYEYTYNLKYILLILQLNQTEFFDKDIAKSLPSQATPRNFRHTDLSI